MLNQEIIKSNWFIDQLNLYQSANSDFDAIKRNFIIREEEFSIITKGLLNKDINDPLQYELILGRRGSGKSTLLKRIEIEITENQKLNKKYFPINLAEEQAGIYRLFDLWEQVLEELQYSFGTIEYKKDFGDFENTQDYTRYLYDLIHQTCVKQKKRIVLLLDNFDRIIENFTDDGNLLREILINFNDIQIIAGSTRMDEHFWRYDMPFYEFFRKHRLEALSREEMLRLLNHWANSLNIPELKEFIKKNPGKLENIRILTDGLPRTLQFFIQIVLQNSQSYGYDYLKKIMDNVTPLYQERLNYLPPQLRKIILEMAFIWEACTTRQLVEKTRMESKLVSANLKTLVLKGVVDKIETSKKNHLYRISERFFNMWLIFTQGNPEQKRKAKCLTIFLENWYNASDFDKLANDHISLLKEKKLNYNEALILSKALSQTKFISLEQRDLILDLTENSNVNKIKNSLIQLPQKSVEIINRALNKLENENYKEALSLVNSIENEKDGIKFNLLGLIYEDQENYTEAEKHYISAIKKENIDAYKNLAIIYQKQNNFKQAEKYYKLAIQNGIDDAINNLGALYFDENKYDEAEKYYLAAIEKSDSDALHNIAIMYQDQKNYPQAEKYLLRNIAKGNRDVSNNLAVVYSDLKKYSKAEKYYLLAIENGDNDALFNIANLYKNQEKYIDATKYYLAAIEKGYDEALNNLAVVYEKQEKYDEAEKYYLLSISKGKNIALRNLAFLYQKQKEYLKAEKYYLLSIEKEETDSLNDLAFLYQIQENYSQAEKYYLKAILKNVNYALTNLADLYRVQEKVIEAEKYYLLAIENNEKDALNNLAILYYSQNKNREKALKLLLENNENPQNLLIAEIWNGIFKDVEKRVFAILKDDINEAYNLIIDLLIHQQKNLVLNLFKDSEIGKALMEKYTVLYYVCKLINNPNNENLELKIPPEIDNTIQEILQEIKLKEKFYGYVK